MKWFNKIRKKAQTFDEIIAAIDSVGGGTVSGKNITPSSAMNQSTVWACVRIISETIAQLPISIQVKESNVWVEAKEHDALGVICHPNDWMMSHDLISFIIHWAELMGNGYLYKAKNTKGDVLGLYPITADSITAKLDDKWNALYEVSSGGSIAKGSYTSKDIFHHRNFGPDGFLGYSTLKNSREGVGLALSLEEYGGAQFKNGFGAGTWLQAKYQLGDESMESLKDSIKKFESSSNAGKTFITEGDITLHQLNAMSAVDAQYLETRRFQKQEIASWYGVPLFLLNDTEKGTTWGTGLEQFSRSFVRFALGPRISRLNQTLIRELINPNDRMNTRFVFDTDAFTLGDFKERMDGYRSGIEAGVLNPDECRDIEGRNSREGGSEYRRPANVMLDNEEATTDET